MYICININVFLFNGNNRSLFLQWEKEGKGGRRWEAWLLGTAHGRLPWVSQVLGRAHGPCGCSLPSIGRVSGPESSPLPVRRPDWQLKGQQNSVLAICSGCWCAGREGRQVSPRDGVASLGSGEEPTHSDQAVSCGDDWTDLAMGEVPRFPPALRSCGSGKGWSLPGEQLLVGAARWDRLLPDIQQSQAGADPWARFCPRLVLKMICWIDKRESTFKNNSVLTGCG